MKTNEKIKAHYAVRVNKFHFKDVTRPTERHHEAIKRHFRDFAELTQRRLDNGESELQPEVAEIVEDTTLPSLGACWTGIIWLYLIFSSEYIKEFARYLATTLQGRDESTLIRKATLKSYIMTFIALWPRYANVHPSKEIRYQVNAYVGSREFITAFDLPTEIRPLK